MLLYAAGILRTHDAYTQMTAESAKTKDYKPMIVACYIKDDTASVYMVYLDESKNTQYSVSMYHLYGLVQYFTISYLRTS